VKVNFIKIWCQIYHASGPLHPNDGKRKYAQLYILDTAEATRQRMEGSENRECDQNVMKKIANLLQNINFYAQAYKSMYEVENEEIQRARAAGREVKPFTMRLRHERSKDYRRYNLPTANEVAVVFEDEDGQPPYNRDFCVHLRNTYSTKRISILNSHLDPMVYPILFPKCDEGWCDLYNNHRGGLSFVRSKLENHLTHHQV